MKVLLVDDEPNIIMSLDFLMRKAKFEVFIARNGQEALDIAQAEQPEIVILDIMMPDIDGYEVCQTIKEQTPDTQVIFLSAKTREEDIAKGLAFGANRYITKPFSTKDLMAQVKEVAKEIR